MAYELAIFINTTTFSSFLIISVILLLMSKRILKRISYRWCITSAGIFLTGLGSLTTSLYLIGAVSSGRALAAGGLMGLLGSIAIMSGLTLALFELLSIQERTALESRRKDINFLLSSLEAKADDGLAKDVIANLKEELIEIERKIEGLK